MSEGDGAVVQHAPDAIPDVDRTDRLDFEYENERGNARVHRTWMRVGDVVRVYDVDSMYNYVEERWEVVHRFVHDYDLADDGETLAGDGSGWRGTGRRWQDWAEERHYELLETRFPHDEVRIDA